MGASSICVLAKERCAAALVVSLTCGQPVLTFLRTLEL